jgi:hypothetical protein
LCEGRCSFSLPRWRRCRQSVSPEHRQMLNPLSLENAQEIERDRLLRIQQEFAYLSGGGLFGG